MKLFQLALAILAAAALFLGAVGNREPRDVGTYTVEPGRGSPAWLPDR